MKSLHNVTFPSYPVNVVGRSAGHGVEKQRVPKQLNVDGDGLTPRFNGFFQAHTYLPGRVGTERIELKLFFLKRQQRQISIEG